LQRSDWNEGKEELARTFESLMKKLKVEPFPTFD
jgi:hypothetical protein